MKIDRRQFIHLGSLIGAGLMVPGTASAASPSSPSPGSTLLIQNSTILTMDPKLGDLEGCDVLIENGTIRKIGKSLPINRAEILDGTDMIVLPGLIDSHWHLWNSLLRSSAPVPGGPAFFETQQRTSKRFTPALAELSVRLGLVEAINAGFTTVNSWSHNIRSPEFAQAELKALAASGIGARFWYGYAQDLLPTSPMDFADIQRVLEQVQQTAQGRLDLGLAVRGPERTGPAIWTKEFEFAAELSLPISTHIAVTRQMQEKQAIQQLASRGLLSPAIASGSPIAEITNRFIDAYHEDMTALGVASPDLEPRVTDHIPEIINLIQRLIDRGHAYVEQGHALFHVPSYPAYGQLSGRLPKDMMAGARVEVAPYKKSPLDFVLWKPSTPEMPGWDSPWGRGRPGWHVECSAMIGHHLGHTIDIHGGGQDLIFPHHENEIAQGACANGTLYCRTWVHNSFVTVDGQKMSKSLGNVLLVRDLLAQTTGEAIRFALLSTHCRRPMDWNAQRLQTAVQTLTRLYSSLSKVSAVPPAPDVAPDKKVLEALKNDLGVTEALVCDPTTLSKNHEGCERLRHTPN